MVWFMQKIWLYSVYSHSCENPVLFITLRTCMNFFLLWNKTIFESGWKESVKLKTKNKKCVIKLHERNRPNLSVYRSVCVSNILRYIEYINNRVGVGEGAILYMCVGVCVCLGFAEAHIWPSSTFLSHWNRITHGSNDKRGQKKNIYIYESADWLMSGSAFDSEFRISVFDSLFQIEARQMWRTKRSQIFVSFSLIFHWSRETSYSTVVKWGSVCCEVIYIQHTLLLYILSLALRLCYF